MVDSTVCRFVRLVVAAAGLAVVCQSHGDVVRRVSQLEQPLRQGTQGSVLPVISANGQYVAFQSQATNLVTPSPGGTPALILVKNLLTGAIVWKSARGDFDPPPLSTPRAIDGVSGVGLTVTDNGSAYWANATDNSVPGGICADSNGFGDIYNDGFIPPTSSTPSGFCFLASNGTSSGPALSWDNLFVGFSSFANNLGSVVDTNLSADIYIKSRLNGAFTKVTFGTGGAATNGSSFRPALSDGALRVAFASVATNLIAGDTNGQQDVFLVDRSGANPVMERISQSTGGAQPNGPSDDPSISADGRYVAYSSTATNLVANDTNGVSDVFLRDRQTGQTRRISVGAGNTQANGASQRPAISGDGRFVAFVSDATNLVADDTNTWRDVFLYDVQAGTVRRISLTESGTQANGPSDDPSISYDGRRVVFDSGANNIVADDTNIRSDIFVWISGEAPSNDGCGTAGVLLLDDPVAGTTYGAAADGGAQCGTSASSPDVYYNFVPPQTAFYTFEMLGGSFDTVLSVHTGCPATAANQLGCNDDAGFGTRLSRLSQVLLNAGEPVKVRVSGFNGAAGDFLVRVFVAVPAGDVCADAVPLAVNTIVNTSNVNAGEEGVSPCQSNTGGDVFYSFTPACSGTFVLETLGVLDTVVSIHTGCPATAANAVGCDDDGGPGLASRLAVNLNGGVNYIVRVAGFSTATGAISLRMNDPRTLNDDCGQAAVISTGATSLNNCAATPAANEVICSSGVARDLWFVYTSTDSATPVTVATGGSVFDTVLGVYSGCPSEGGTLLGCNDDFGGTFQSLVRADVPAGTPVWIRVGGFMGSSGDGQVTVSQCLADVAGDGPFPDGTVDGNDFIAFINSFSIGNAQVDPVADVITDGTIDGSDFIAFINAFGAGC